MTTSKESSETKSPTVADEIKAELATRDKLAIGLVNLKADTEKRKEEQVSEGEKRSRLVLDRVDLIAQGATAEGLDKQIAESRQRSDAHNEAIVANSKAINDRTARLEQAESALKRATFKAIKNHRPDAEVDALFNKAMDAVEAWQATYNDLLTELGVRQKLALIDGEWRLPLDPHLTNETIRRLQPFVPTISQPEQAKSAKAVNIPANEPLTQQAASEAPTAKPEQPERPEKPKALTPEQVQADARRNGRNSVLRAKQKPQEYAEF